MRQSSRLTARLLALRGQQSSSQALLAQGWQHLAPIVHAPEQGKLWEPCCSHCAGRSLTTGTTVQKQQPPASEVPLDSEHVNISNEIDKEIIKAASSESSSELFEVVELHGEEFTEINVATLFHSLGDLGTKKGADEKESIQNNPTFHTLIDMVVMGRRRYNVKHLSQILQALAQLNYDNDMVFDRMSQHIMDKLPKADAATLVNLATALAAMEHSPSIVLFEGIQKQSAGLKDKLTKEQKAALDKAFSKLGYSELGAKVK